MKRIAVIMLVSCFMALPLWAAKTDMTYDEYETALAGAQQREKDAKEQVAQEQAKIESLRQQIDELDRQIASVLAEIYAILGITEDDVSAIENEIALIRQDLQQLMALSPEELAKRLGDIKKIEARITDIKRKPAAMLNRITVQIAELDQMLAQLKANIPANSASNSYTVRLNEERRDCLYRIAEYDFVYGDPSQWPKIYRANKNEIDKKFNRYVRKATDSKYSRPQDLIHPGDVLDIPR